MTRESILRDRKAVCVPRHRCALRSEIPLPAIHLQRVLAKAFQARREGQARSGAKRQRIKGWEDGRKSKGACAGRPRLKGIDAECYAALAFLTAAGFAGLVWTLAAVFLVACAFSFAANSALTFWAIASVSTL